MEDAGAVGVFRDAIQLIAEGLAEVTGFGVAAISVVHGEDDHLTMFAVAGDEQARSQLLGRRTPVAEIQAEIDRAERWGNLCFVAGDGAGVDAATFGWVPELTPSEDPTDWHPLDLLIAPFYDADGRLRGHMAIDMPDDGKRPGPAKQAQLQRFARQAGRAVLTAYEREVLTEQVRLAETARAVVRHASADLDLDRILDVTQDALTTGFKAVGGWMQTFDHRGSRASRMFATHHDVPALPEPLMLLGARAARELWREQAAVVITNENDFGDMATPEEGRQLLDYLAEIGVVSILVTPLGAGRASLGLLVLCRREGQPAWSAVELSAVLDIGHDLGRAVLNARNLARERELVTELRELDDYKRELISTISHELKTPLTSTLGHLELLEAADVPTHATGSLRAIGRSAERMQRTIEDLLVLSEISDSNLRSDTGPVDLGAVITGVLDMLRVAAEGAEVELRPELPDTAALVLGDPLELDRLASNLVSNAVKYSLPGGVVDVVVTHEGHDVGLTVRDAGLGISEVDQERLFEEFFRSTNPEARRRPGTGLGLSIVRRIVERHDGEITVESKLGQGSTFRVRLPAPDDGLPLAR